MNNKKIATNKAIKAHSQTKSFLISNTLLVQSQNRNTRKRYEICSKLAIKTPERLH